MTRNVLLRLLAFLAVAAVAAFAVTEINQRSIDENEKTQQENVQAIKRAELWACERVQLLRDQANGTNFLIYDTFDQAAESQRQALKDYKTDAGRGSARAALERAENVRDTTVVTGPTDCNGAVFNPDNYEAPAPEFVKDNSAQVQEARRRAEAIVRKAKLGLPLEPEGNRRP